MYGVDMVFNSDIQTSLKCDLTQYIHNYHMALDIHVTMIQASGILKQ